MMKRILGLMRRYMNASSSVSFWHTPIGQVVYDFPSLVDYPIDLTAKCNYAGPFDCAGIPMLDYTGEIGVQYNPCACAQYALGNFQRWQRLGDNAARAQFFKIAEWLCESEVIDNDGQRGFWLYHFDLDSYGVKAPWRSGLAQAQAISVLARAVRFASDRCISKRCRESLERGFAGLITHVEVGGLTLRADEDVWIEEVVAERRTAILDGCLFALFGVKDYTYLTSSPVGEEVFSAGMRTILRYLPTFDLGYWSRADLYLDYAIMPSSHFYHNLHVHQLRAMYALTGEAEFARYASKWDSYQSSWINRQRAFVNKAIFKIRYY